MNIPSRRQRREIAKKFGLTKEKESFAQWTERIKRSREFGKALQLQHLQEIENKNNPISSQNSIKSGEEGLTIQEWKDISSGENTEA